MFIFFETPNARYGIRMTSIKNIRYLEDDTSISIQFMDNDIVNYNFYDATTASAWYYEICKQMKGES